MCEPGTDYTCNADPNLASIAGECSAEGTCTCADPFGLEPVTGRCF